jgi:phage terminase large subunit
MSLILLREKNVTITVARKTMPSLKSTAMKETINALKQINAYRVEWHNKSDHIYKYPPTKSEIDFLSVDDPMRIRSRRRNYLWLNEGNEFTKEDYMQLSMRTDKMIFTDYNPSHQYHWIYDDIQTREDCVVIPSTYKDNPFLQEEIIKEIENWKGKDENYWRVYGLGMKGVIENIIYPNWKLCDTIPEGEIIYGLDFGFNNPTALVKITIHDDDIYIQEMIYKSGMTNEDLIRELKRLNIEGIIYADSSEPQRIEEISRAGFYINPSDKDVKKGIDTLKSKNKYITKQSVNTIEEIKKYCYKADKDGKLMEEPVKINDHAMDATRYAVHTHLNLPAPGFEWL